MKTTGPFEGLDNFGNERANDGISVENKKEDRLDANIFAIAALALGVIGAILAFMSSGSKLTGVIAVLGIVALIILYVDVKSQIKEDPQTEGVEFGQVKITAEFAAGYYLALIAFVVAAIFSFRKPKHISPSVTQPGAFPVTSTAVPPGDNTAAGGGGVVS
jgi:hypothetical protein